MSADGAWKAELQGLGGDEKAARLRDAAGRGDLDRLSELIKVGADVNKCDRYGYSALMRASLSGHDECIPVLLEAGAELELANNNGWTALMNACHSGREASTLTLLNVGANPLAASKADHTAARLETQVAKAQYVPAEERERCRRCVQLLQQPRVPVPWSPANHAQFPKCNRKRAAALGQALRCHRIWNAEAAGGSEAVRHVWLDFVSRYVSALVPPMSRVVA